MENQKAINPHLHENVWQQLNKLLEKEDFRASLYIDRQTGKFLREPVSAYPEPPSPIRTVSPEWSRSASFVKSRTSSDVREEILIKAIREMELSK